MDGLFAKMTSLLAGLSGKGGTTDMDRERYTDELLSMDMDINVIERLMEKMGAPGTDPSELLKERMKQILLSVPLCAPACGILMVGINGSGKTTTIAKLGRWYTDRGYSVIVGAGDTYRAAAIDQLSILAGRTGIDIVKAKPGVDPASVIHDAVMAYRHRAMDVVIGDTAGRLHTNVNLVNELKKIKSVMTRAMAGDRLVTYLVMDATIGKNSFQQAKLFEEHIGIDGIIITKLDGTAKAGIIFTICDVLGLPVVAIGTGEGMDDFMPFDRDAFVEGLFK
ncbi:MAG: signal recognition particle-docking protein FtsY [Deltaproteobacteria bacterium]|nr:signal recognition particle-docking protein FtsY [Deltaproteobacteria bacterium]MCL5277250.1 signal recognition particle-docking protein FtsY [Deltaproteobacteria bacterium]